MQPPHPYQQRGEEKAIEGEDSDEEDSGVALDNITTTEAGEHTTDTDHSMHHGDHYNVHTLEETIDEEQPFLFHLNTGGGAGREQHEQHTTGTARGRSLSNASGTTRPIRSLSGRIRRTSTGGAEHGSRVREVIRDGEIVPVVLSQGHEEQTLDPLDEENEWTFEAAGTGHTLADPTRLQRVQRTLKRVYNDWSGLFSLISVSLSR